MGILLGALAVALIAAVLSIRYARAAGAELARAISRDGEQ